MYDLHAQEAEGTVCKGIDRGEAKKKKKKMSSARSVCIDCLGSNRTSAATLRERVA